MTGIQSQMKWGDNEGLTQWWGDHAFAHTTYGRLITTAKVPVLDVADQKALAEAVISMDPEQKDAPTPSLDAWMLAHNALHLAEFQGLTLQGTFDVAVADFSNPGAFEDWMQRHQALHDAENKKLGI